MTGRRTGRRRDARRVPRRRGREGDRAPAGADRHARLRRAHLEHTRVGRQEKGDPALVAKQGFAAMMRGHDEIDGGSVETRLTGSLGELLPEPIEARQHGKLAEPAGLADLTARTITPSARARSSG